MSRVPRIPEGLLAIALAIVVAGPAAAAGGPAVDRTGSSFEAGPFGEANEAELTEADAVAYWKRRLANALKRIELARQRVAEVDAEYSRARHDRDQRGEDLAAIKERREAAHKELQEAEHFLPPLVERARRQGVPAGFLQTYWDLLEHEEEVEG